MKDIANKKGFTLIELLAVIALLAILVVIVVPKVYDYWNSGKSTALQLQEKNVEDAAKLFLEDFCKNPINYTYSARCTSYGINKIKNNNIVTYSGKIKLDDLITVDYIDSVTFQGNNCDTNSYVIVADGNVTAYLCCGDILDGTHCTNNSTDWKQEYILSGE